MEIYSRFYPAQLYRGGGFLRRLAERRNLPWLRMIFSVQRAMARSPTHPRSASQGRREASKRKSGLHQGRTAYGWT